MVGRSPKSHSARKLRMVEFTGDAAVHQHLDRTEILPIWEMTVDSGEKSDRRRTM